MVKLKNCVNPRKKARNEKKLWPIPFLKGILWFWRISEQFGGLAKVAIEPVVPFALVLVFVIFLLRKWKQPLLGSEKAHASSISQIHHLHQLFENPGLAWKWYSPSEADRFGIWAIKTQERHLWGNWKNCMDYVLERSKTYPSLTAWWRCQKMWLSVNCNTQKFLFQINYAFRVWWFRTKKSSFVPFWSTVFIDWFDQSSQIKVKKSVAVFFCIPNQAISKNLVKTDNAAVIGPSFQAENCLVIAQRVPTSIKHRIRKWFCTIIERNRFPSLFHPTFAFSTTKANQINQSQSQFWTMN